MNALQLALSPAGGEQGFLRTRSPGICDLDRSTYDGSAWRKPFLSQRAPDIPRSQHDQNGNRRASTTSIDLLKTYPYLVLPSFVWRGWTESKLSLSLLAAVVAVFGDMSLFQSILRSS